MPVFYRGPRAFITHQRIEVPHEGRRCFRIAELSGVHIVRVDQEYGVDRNRAMGVSALVAALVTLPLALPPAVLTVVVLGGLVVYAAVCLRTRSSCWRLVASYQGEVTILFESPDEREFDQVCRGLLRSLEYNDS